jgi:NTE family protein
VSLQYNHLGKYSTSLYGNTYFGKLYNAGQIKGRMDVPGKLPYYIEPSYTINRFDFFNSTSIAAYIEDVKPSYLIRTDQNTSLSVGIPARSKGKFVFTGALVYLSDQYYQTSNFGNKDTADRTTFLGNSFSAYFERNTLNRKQYPNAGTYLTFKIRRTQGTESYTPGSTSKSDVSLDQTHKAWYQLKATYLNYYQRLGPVHLGIHLEGVYSRQPFFSNYYSTILSAPSFAPISDSKTFFQPTFSTHTFFSVGSVNSITIKGNLNLRLEGYLYQPYQEILEDAATHVALYGKPFERRFFIGSANLVYFTPIGPASLSLNYYDNLANPWSILFHFGFIIFNDKALD